jgi:hypothetical protein
MPSYNDRLSKICAAVVPTPIEELRRQQAANLLLPIDYRAFLMNEGDHDLKSVEMYTGGFEGSENGVTELNRLTRSLGELRRGNAVLIEELDIGILDFFLWYHFNLHFADDVQLKAWFSINKAYSLRSARYCPALKADTYYFSLGPRSDKQKDDGQRRQENQN